MTKRQNSEKAKGDVLYIVMPAYNEQDNIEQVVNDWYPIVEEYGDKRKNRFVVVDDGSKDETYNILKKLAKDRPILQSITKKNSGHGATVLYAYHYALEHGADYVFQTDSDGQTLPAEFDGFWRDRNRYSAIIGHRNHRKDGLSRIFVTKTLKAVLRIIFKVNVVDANTPYRLMDKNILSKYINQVPKDFNLSNVMLTVLFVYNDENIDFRPITFRPRQGGTNSINLKKISKIGRQAVKDFRQIKKGLKETDDSK